MDTNKSKKKAKRPSEIILHVFSFSWAKPATQGPLLGLSESPQSRASTPCFARHRAQRQRLSATRATRGPLCTLRGSLCALLLRITNNREGTCAGVVGGFFCGSAVAVEAVRAIGVVDPIYTARKSDRRKRRLFAAGERPRCVLVPYLIFIFHSQTLLRHVVRVNNYTPKRNLLRHRR
jgi:hypothetical protein